MRHQGYVVKLSTQERGRLEDIIRKGKNPAQLPVFCARKEDFPGG